MVLHIVAGGFFWWVSSYFWRREWCLLVLDSWLACLVLTASCSRGQLSVQQPEMLALWGLCFGLQLWTFLFFFFLGPATLGMWSSGMMFAWDTRGPGYPLLFNILIINLFWACVTMFGELLGNVWVDASFLLLVVSFGLTLWLGCSLFMLTLDWVVVPLFFFFSFFYNKIWFESIGTRSLRNVYVLQMCLTVFQFKWSAKLCTND